MASQSSDTRGPLTRFAVALFPGFQALDVFGPIDTLNMLSKQTPIHLDVLAKTLDPVSTRTDKSGHTAFETIVPTRTFADYINASANGSNGNAKDNDIEVLLIPGGGGTRDPDNIEEVVDLVRAAYPRLRYLLTVCTGSAVAAMSGILDGHRATTNKLAWDWVIAQGPKVNWVRRARWVTDGNIWTSSGISAGIDMMYAFVGDQYGADTASKLAFASEYVRNTDPDMDPFAGDGTNGVKKA
ncbi:class I glutamine amidotransferase-like protein [Hypoxylon trugodes]|uniref:class I glutamine amidotransferase-like protein n=1 Tax=Hypoxylon trugodes TaxID=326681 RepID=UPI0021A24430|nr:class I glutamine amidotransferase-like protein [Hypoxylon trugodes]KAI1392399.1 class I glutamine amidotransferase-like protein [Hypoxylon trugodes]